MCIWALALCVFFSKRHAEQISLCICCPFSLTDTLTVWKNTVVDLFQTASWIAFYYFQLLLKGLVLMGKVQDWFHCKSPLSPQNGFVGNSSFPLCYLKDGPLLGSWTVISKGLLLQTSVLIIILAAGEKTLLALPALSSLWFWEVALIWGISIILTWCWQGSSCHGGCNQVYQLVYSVDLWVALKMLLLCLEFWSGNGSFMNFFFLIAL